MFFNNSFWISSHGAAINFLIWTFSLSSDFFTNQLDFSVLSMESSAIYCPITNLFPSFWLFLVLFWRLWMLGTVFKPCHVPHVSRITTLEILFAERCFSVSKELVRSWSHVSLIVHRKQLLKSLRQSVQNPVEKEKKKKKEKKGNCKALCAKRQTQKQSDKRWYMQLSSDKKPIGFCMAATVNAVCASKRFFEIRYSKYQRYMLLQLIVTCKNSYRRMFICFRWTYEA